MTRPLVLALDTSTPALSCALLSRSGDGVRVLGVREASPPAVVSTLVPGLFDELLREAGATLDDVGVLVSGLGPGLFTGVRVALATMKALAYARRLPLLGAGSLEAMALSAAHGRSLGPGDELAYGATRDSGWCCPVIDARKGEVYFGVYRFREGVLETAAPPQAGPPAIVTELVASSAASPRAVGAGLKALGPGWDPTPPLTPGAAELAFLALERQRAPSFVLEEVLALEPTYLRPPEAEVARQRRAAGLA
jgi:tRNA threonylcarbamoyladenosine biosynthesis protein TsaB